MAKLTIMSSLQLSGRVPKGELHQSRVRVLSGDSVFRSLSEFNVRGFGVQLMVKTLSSQVSCSCQNEHLYLVPKKCLVRMTIQIVSVCSCITYTYFVQPQKSCFFFILLLIFDIVICFITLETYYCFPAGRKSKWCHL